MQLRLSDEALILECVLQYPKPGRTECNPMICTCLAATYSLFRTLNRVEPNPTPLYHRHTTPPFHFSITLGGFKPIQPQDTFLRLPQSLLLQYPKPGRTECNLQSPQ